MGVDIGRVRESVGGAWLANCVRMRWLAALFFIVSAPGLWASGTADGSHPPVLNIGVLAFRGADEALERWSATADYLAASLPDYSFRVIPLTLDKMAAMLGNNTSPGALDFVLTNPGNYVTLEAQFGISRLATFVGRGASLTSSHLSSVIFTRADSAVQRLTDLHGKVFSGISEKAFGGFQLAWHEMSLAGLDPYKDLKALRFVGFPHKRVVNDVVQGRADAGVVRAGVLEWLAEKGELDLTGIRILAQKQRPEFNLLHSTALYPQWPFARTSRISAEFARSVAIALYAMKPQDKAARDSFGAGWTIPMNYSPVRRLLADLKIGPYRQPPPTLFDFLQRYYPIMLSVAAVLMLLASAVVYTRRTNRRLSISEAELKRHRDNLEDVVTQRTLELSNANRALENDIDIRTRVEAELRRNNKTLFALYLAFGDVGVAYEQRLQRAIRIARDYLHADGGYLFRAEGDQLALCLLAGDELTEQDPAKPLASSSLRVWQQSSDAGGNPVGQPPVLRGEAGGDAYIAIPVITHGRLHCVLEFRRVASTVQQQDSSILLLVAQWLSSEIEARSLAEQHRQHREQLARFGRISSLGELALSIAHELNQPLTIARNYLGGCGNLIHGNPVPLGEISAGMTKATVNIERASEILQRLRDFVRGDNHHCRAADVGGDIESVLGLMKAEFTKHQIDVKADLSHREAKVFVDPIHIQQILVNLLTNSMDAMQQSGVDKRQITIKTRVIEDHLIVSVIDNGGGLSDDLDVHTVIDAFVSTKESGMGMGLSICRTLVEAAQGTLRVSENQWSGLTVSMRFPLYRPDEVAA